MPARMARTLLSIALLPLLLFLVPSNAAPAGSSDRALPASFRLELLRRAPYGGLAEAVRADAVAREVARSAASGAAEGFLVLSGDGALRAAVRSAPTGAGRTAAVLQATGAAYAAQKDRVLGRLGGVTVLTDYAHLPMLFVRFSGSAAVLGASNDPEVAGIAANLRRESNLAQSLPLIGQPTAAGAGHTGDGTAVAVLDTGVDFTHPAFGSCTSPGSPASCRVVLAQDTAPNDGQLDDDGHGTNVSGIVAGVAPTTRLLVYDVFDGNGAFDADVFQAVDSAIANQATFNVVAMNLSLGLSRDFNTSSCGGGANAGYTTAFSNARAVGIAPVVAAGNDASAIGLYTDGIGSPACVPGAISVGAVYDGNNGGLNWGDCIDQTTAADQITCFSQSASILTLLAPGALIVAAGIEQGGTSQASPLVAGAFAVLEDASPGHTIDEITTALANSGPSILDSRNGVTKHRFDLPGAIAALQGQPTPTTSPSPTTPPPTTPPPGGCTIEGSSSAEVLEGTSGDDVICGNGGDDYLIPGGGNDTVIGGGGFDFVSYEDSTGPVVVDLGTGSATGFGSHSLSQIEGVVGSPFGDTITGNSSSNDILGLGGDDLLVGSGGFDYLRFDFANGVAVDLSEGLSDGEGLDAFSGFEGIVGSPGGDVLGGKRGGNEIFGLRGPDGILGRGGDDLLSGMGGPDDLFGGKGDDDMFGGPGNDRCSQGPGSGVANSC